MDEFVNLFSGGDLEVYSSSFSPDPLLIPFYLFGHIFRLFLDPILSSLLFPFFLFFWAATEAARRDKRDSIIEKERKEEGLTSVKLQTTKKRYNLTLEAHLSLRTLKTLNIYD